ncbi:MAG: phosphodiester glycosidase family protein [Ignavibacterium sp.]|nr:phosphodiester glycosidase family protein [Ignavibacterium sp.]
MKKIFILFIISFSIALSQPITWTEITSNYQLPAGIKIFQGDRATPKLKIFYIEVDMNNPNLVIHPYISSTNRNVRDFVTAVGSYAGVNGGFFSGSTSLSAVVYPYEVKAQNVAAVTRFSQTYPVIRSFFGMKTNRTFSVDWIYHFGSNVSDIYKFNAPLPYTNNQQTPLPAPQQSAGQVYQNLLVGIGGAPTLVKNGQVNITYDQEIMWGSGVGYDNRDPRTAVGYTANNRVIMIVADGRQTNSEGVGLPELAQIMVNLGCIEAMNLDGGGSSQMAVKNQYVNSPSELRAVPTILTVTHKDSLRLPPTIYFEKIIDTGDPECSLVGPGWFASANPGYWGNTPAQLNPVGNGSSYAEFRPRIFTEAIYEVYAWWVSAPNRCQDTPFIIKHKNGTDTIRINQVQNGSKWNLIGSFTFSNDTSQKIIISNAGTPGTSTTYIVADAIRLISYNPATNIKDNEVIQLSDFKLFQNYPNPFNPITKITWQSPVAGLQTLKVYDILGREVATLINEYREAGKFEIDFSVIENEKASSLPSGVYFYQLKIGNFTDTKKMVLLR